MILLVGGNSTLFSQTVTDSVKCFQISVVRQIAKDLVKGDSAIAELNLANEMITNLNDKIGAQEQIIMNYERIDSTYNERIRLDSIKYGILNNLLIETKREVKKEKINKVKYSVATGLVATLLFLIF